MPHALSRFMDSVVKSKQANDNGTGCEMPLCCGRFYPVPTCCITLAMRTGSSRWCVRTRPSTATHWALLIAGSGGYGNYRHQADVAHSYQVMRAGGLKPEHIIVMMADDVAFSVENPFPGALIMHIIVVNRA